MIDTFGTGVVSEAAISESVLRHVDLRPAAIIERFGLRRPIYSALAAYGHMGREELAVSWEERDLAPILREELLK
jgi:S-adenosylmethionine synthetase